MKKSKYAKLGVKPARLTKRACLEKVKSFRKLADKKGVTKPNRFKLLKMAAWYKHRAKA